MKTISERKQQIANSLNGLGYNDAKSILKDVLYAIKYNSKVRFEKDHYTKEIEPATITMTYRTRFCSGIIDALQNLDESTKTTEKEETKEQGKQP